MNITEALTAIKSKDEIAARPLSWQGKGRAVIFIESTESYEVFGFNQFPTNQWDLLGDWQIVTFDEVIHEQRESGTSC